MALVVNDRVKETSTTTGTGTLSLAGAVTGFETFVAGIGNSNTTYYAIVNTNNGEFEVGLGTVTDGTPDTLARTTIISSSNSDNAVDFSAGTKNVFVTLPASKSVILDSSGNIVANNGSNLTALNATQLTSGTVPDARFPATLPALNGSALTALNATQLTSGTVPDARFPATLPALNGSALTNLDAANLATNLVPTARLGTGTASSTTFLAGDQTYKTITADITAVTAGDGLTGGGSSGDVTLNVGAGNLIDVQADQIDVDLSELTTSTSDADGDFFAVVDAANAQKKLTKGNIAISGFNNDSGFIDGSALNASNLSSGTVPDARFPATLPALNGSALTALNATQLTSGTVPDARFPGTLPALNGSALTNLDAANLATNLVPTARLGTGTASSTTFLAGDQTYKTITADITAVTAGNGLTGGGSSGDVTLNVGAGNLIDVQADQIDVDLSELTTSTSNADGDFFVVVDSANAQKKLTKGNINNSGFNNDAGYTTNVGDITGVTAGNGLTGGGASGSVTLNVGAGTGIDVAADTVAVDVSDFMTNGSNNRVVTATGADAMNAEANMTFDGTDLSIPQNIVHLGDTNCYIGFHATDQWRVVTSGAERFEVNSTAITAARNFVPGANDTYDLGASGNVWRNLYTGDLHLSNEAKDEGNAVDGTKGNWTIQEGAENLYILNNKSGKKYKFKLEEM